MSTRLDPHSALLIVDVQNDFCPGGALPVAEGDQVVQVLNRWIAEAQAEGAHVYASRDWHPPEHGSFRAKGGPWPSHCVQNTPGAEIRRDLRLPPDAFVVDKGVHEERDNYSAFDGTGLAQRLRADGVERIWVGGLAQDYCVLYTVLDGLARGFEVHVLTSATRPVEAQPGDGARALEKMRAGGALIEA